MKVPSFYIEGRRYIEAPFKEYVLQALFTPPFLSLYTKWINSSSDSALIDVLENQTEEGKALWLEVLKKRIVS